VEIARLIGSAGSGKTTALLDIMEKALERLNHDPLRLGLASMTRAARGEAVSRAAVAWGVPETLLSKEGWFRTVHSTCHRALSVSRGQLIGSSKADAEWISQAVGVPIQVEIDQDTGMSRVVGNPKVERALSCWDLARASLVPVADVHRRAASIDPDMPGMPEIVRTIERYEAAKRLDDRLDYADLLARFAGFRFDPADGLSHCSPQGMLPEVSAWLFDEQQDASPLLDAACKRLISAPSVQWCYVVGDAFQSIYGFAGSSADCFMSWPAKKQRIMDRSYRCPKAVLELGERCLRRMYRGYFDRQVKAYGRDGQPRADDDGKVHEISDLGDMISLVDPTKDWLLVARTKYQARRIAAAMHSRSKPFRWTWQETTVSARSIGLQALLKLEEGKVVSGDAWAKALTLLPQRSAGGAMLSRGTKTKWKDSSVASDWNRDGIHADDLVDVGATPALQAAIRSGEWVRLVDDAKTWRETAKKWGPQLAAEPKVRIGTVHSVKGAEGDNVAFLTTTSQRVQSGADDQEQHDEECRIAYVAVTRARHNLYIVNDGGRTTPRMEVL